MGKETAAVTIITPTYNRADRLKDLYESLKRQTVREFEWLIVDDGSTDQTRQTVQDFCTQEQVRVRYLHRENGGKHRALNTGISMIDTELTFIVDSDDYLPDDAVETILAYHEKYKGREGLCGYSFLRCYPDGRVNTSYFKQDEEISTYRDVRINGDIGGDKAEVFYTRILKQFPFPEYEGERFLPEDLVWMQMSGPYRMVHINKCIYIGEYLEGGLTRTGRAMKIYSPRGMMQRSTVYLDDDGVYLKVKLKMMLLYIIYGRFARIPVGRLYAGTSRKLMFAVSVLPAGLLYHKWKRENERK
ncbi:MAG: glycosyltransferase family 2 protein [Lachnospiraceae bacterium]|nr:glycosyltransferase family 2 protein [Lachnospiraceae bacterium]